MTEQYMVDTNIFNWIAEDSFDLQSIEHSSLFLTSAQLAEVEKAPQAKREKLLSIIKNVAAEKLPLASAVWGHFEWGEMEWGSTGNGLYDQILKELGGSSYRSNNTNDALIGEVALTRRLILLTADKKLAKTLNKIKSESAKLIEKPN